MAGKRRRAGSKGKTRKETAQAISPVTSPETTPDRHEVTLPKKRRVRIATAIAVIPITVSISSLLVEKRQ